MRLLWVDASQGAAGDMLLAALLDAGADEAAVQAGLARLAVEPVSVRTEQVRRHGMRARRAHVEVSESVVLRTLPDIAAIVTGAGLAGPVEQFAMAVFDRLAKAEAAVHGVGIDEVHFHEVGALDSIVDVVGCALALHSLDIFGDQVEVVVSPVAVGSGTVRTEHGVIGVPGPAVLELLADAPVAGHHASMELCTPTGAALLTTLVDRWGPLPACVPRGVGVGGGRHDPPGHANVLRVVLADLDRTGAVAQLAESFAVVEATVDDIDPRLWPDILTAMRSVSTADAWCTPMVARNGRPAQILSVLTPTGRVDAVCHAVFAHTTTLGLRIHPVERRSLARSEFPVSYRGERVSVKTGLLDGAIVTAQPEYDDVRKAADKLGLPVRQVLAEVSREATASLSDH